MQGYAGFFSEFSLFILMGSQQIIICLYPHSSASTAMRACIMSIGRSRGVFDRLNEQTQEIILRLLFDRVNIHLHFWFGFNGQ